MTRAREAELVAADGPPNELLFGAAYTTSFVPEVTVERRALRTRRDAAEHIGPRVKAVKREIVDDVRAWSWLGMYHFVDITNVADQARVSPLDGAFVIRSSSRALQQRYRHYLWGTWRLHEQHGEAAAFLLDEPLTSWSDLAQRAFGSIRAFNSPGVLPLMLRLYTRNGSRRRGYSQNPGGVRHLLRVLDQLERTYDVYGMTPEALLDILPEPFRQWADEDDQQPDSRTPDPEVEALLRALRAVRDAVNADSSQRTDLRHFMTLGSPEWKAYVADHGTPGYQTRQRTVLRRLDETLRKLGG
ncbi:MAG: hypothetical protein OXH70_14310 [Acidobacteria bacterium]|nr:hypothetical protein [Acidobacteriota bacterium]